LLVRKSGRLQRFGGILIRGFLEARLPKIRGGKEKRERSAYLANKSK